MESLLKQWDGETMIIRFDQPSRAWIFIALHSTRLGPPVSGGTRMKSYPDTNTALQDAMRLSAAMTAKLVLAGIAHGGGKAVIALPADFDPAKRSGLLRRYGDLLQQLKGLFLTGPDVGTSPADMDVIAETGAPYVFSRTPQKGGAGDSGPGTAVGVLAAMRVTCERLFGSDSLAGKRILIQGTGHVGRSLIEMLRKVEAKILFSEIDQAAVHYFRDDLGLEFAPPDKLYETPCDIFSPCALGGLLNQEAIPQLRCRAVVGSANNQLASPEDAGRLREREILYAPDIAINIGGLMSIVGMEVEGWSQGEAYERVSNTVTRTLSQIYDLAEAEGLNTHAAALRLVEKRLAQSGSRRNGALFFIE